MNVELDITPTREEYYPMLLIVTPLTGWRRKILVYRFLNATEKEIFEALQAVNEDFQNRGVRDTVNITLIPIAIEQLPDWIDNNIEPNWWERIRRKIHYIVTILARES